MSSTPAADRALRLASYKIRFHDRHVRAVPADFTGPGVDLRGAEADLVIAAAAPVLAWLGAREPGVVVRSLSVNRARVLVSLEPGPNDPRPRALRFDEPYATELRDAGRDAERAIATAALSALARRA